MAASALALKRCFLSGLIHSGSRLPVILSAASRLFSTRAHDPFYDVYGATKVSHPDRQLACSMKPTDDDYDSSCDVKRKDTADALHLRLFMPGVAKEDAKVYVVNGEMIAEGKKEKDFEDDVGVRVMRVRMYLPLDRVKVNAITSEMKNGVLKVCIPRVEQ